MDRATAVRLLERVDECFRLIKTTAEAVRGSSEPSLALYQLHSAAVLGAIVSYIAVPAWKDHRDLRDIPTSAEAANYQMSADAVAAVVAGLEGVRKVVSDVASMVAAAGIAADERRSYEEGIRKIMGYLDEAVDVISRQHE